MAQHGGYRQPANPAPVSGIGSRSARTDGGVMDPNAPEYGEGVEIQNLKSAAPTGGPSAPQGQMVGQPMPPNLTPLTEPSQDSRPVTSGAAAGPGPGADALGLPMNPGQELKADARALPAPLVQALLAQASSPDATPSFRRVVRQIIAYG